MKQHDLFSHVPSPNLRLHPKPFYPDTPGFTNDSTSKQAADAVKPSAQSWRDRALAAIERAGRLGLTTNELAEQLKVSRDTIQPRTSELKAAGLIVDSGERRFNDNNKRAIVWKVPK